MLKIQIRTLVMMLTAMPAFAQSGAIPALPLAVQQAGDIAYVNGGIGDEELAQLKAQNTLYNLQIMLSTPAGAYISDVRLRLLGERGDTLLDVPDAGPYLYAKLPAGAYTLETTSPGEPPESLAITIPAAGTVKKHITYRQP